jgi:hypothetical protein
MEEICSSDTSEVEVESVQKLIMIHEIERKSLILIVKIQSISYTNIMFRTLSIVLFLFKNTTFRRLDSVSVFRWNLLSWVQSVELILISGPLYQHLIRYTGQAQHICGS